MIKRFLLIFAAIGIGAVPITAIAHPLGNFTINHLTEAHFSHNSVAIRYVLDQAEIPSYQTMRQIDPSGKLSAAQLEAWGRTAAADSLTHITLTIGNMHVPLGLIDVHASTRPGAGGLPTLYLVADARGTFVSGPQSQAFTLHDGTAAGRLGWRDEIVFPEEEPTRELTAYPSALVGSPHAITTLTGTLHANGIVRISSRTDDMGVAATTTSTNAASPSGNESLARSNQLSDMIARGTNDWTFVVLTFGVAIALGALHALEPGHGKTLLAISLVGARATVKQAAILAFALTLAHTIGVLALGMALNLFKGYFVPEDIYPWITLLSGIVIAIIGARAIARELRKRFGFVSAHVHTHAHPHTHPHTHSHDHASEISHDHNHDDMDDAEHAMLHAIPGTAPLRFGPTVWAAMSGGIAPCPAALVVLLAAIALNQVTYGIFVIVAFSFGLAGTLTTLGIAVVRGAGWLQRRPQFDRFVRFGPLISALVISLIGSVMVGQGFVEKGVTVPALAVSAMVILVIAGYVFSHPFGHKHVEIV